MPLYLVYENTKFIQFFSSMAEMFTSEARFMFISIKRKKMWL